MSVDRLLPYNDEDIMEHELTPFSVHPSFKQVLIQDKETPIQPSTAPVISEYPYSEANPDTPKSNSEKQNPPGSALVCRRTNLLSATMEKALCSH